MKASYKFDIKLILKRHEFIMSRNEIKITFIKDKVNHSFS